jgi:hypothetical protein
MSQFAGSGDPGGGFPPSGEEDGGATLDPDSQLPGFGLQLRSNPEINSMMTHGISRLLLALILRILPPLDTRSELADHGYKAEAETPDEVLEDSSSIRLATRPTNVPFAYQSPNPRYQGPRSSLRVSR